MHENLIRNKFKQIFLHKCLQDVSVAEDSCSNTWVIDTPTSKTGAKRSSDSIDFVAVEHGQAGEDSWSALKLMCPAFKFYICWHTCSLF